jgi:RNA polymerase sigma-70 factor, ECF subfamily
VKRAKEKQLLQSARKGDADAFAVLYRETVQQVFRYIYYRVSEQQLAEDLTGDVFIRALNAIGRYEERGKPFIAWLYSIAHARVVDHYRKTDRRPIDETIDDNLIISRPDMDANLMRRKAAQILREAISTLTAGQQQVIIMRFIEGYNIEETAQIMGKKANAIKALQHRALRALASRLERSGFDLDEILEGLS